MNIRQRAAIFCLGFGIAFIGGASTAEQWMKTVLQAPEIFYVWQKAEGLPNAETVKKIVYPDGAPATDLEKGFARNAYGKTVTMKDGPEWTTAIEGLIREGRLDARPVQPDETAHLRTIFPTAREHDFVKAPDFEDVNYKARIAAIPAAVKALSAGFASWGVAGGILLIVASAALWIAAGKR